MTVLVSLINRIPDEPPKGRNRAETRLLVLTAKQKKCGLVFFPRIQQLDQPRSETDSRLTSTSIQATPLTKQNLIADLIQKNSKQ